MTFTEEKVMVEMMGIIYPHKLEEIEKFRFGGTTFTIKAEDV